MLRFTYKPTIIALQETHLDDKDSRKFSKIRWQTIYVPSVGASGGLSLSWLQSLIDVKVISMNYQSIHAIIAICLLFMLILIVSLVMLSGMSLLILI